MPALRCGGGILEDRAGEGADHDRQVIGDRAAALVGLRRDDRIGRLDRRLRLRTEVDQQPVGRRPRRRCPRAITLK